MQFILDQGISAVEETDGTVMALAALYHKLLRHTQAVVVLCQQATHGGGMIFPAMGDIVVATAEATFGFPQAELGGLLGVVSVAARRRMQDVQFRRSVMSGEPFTAAEAQRLGLVDIVVSSSEEAGDRIKQMVRRLRSIQPKLLHTCKTVFPMASVEEALVIMGQRAVSKWLGGNNVACNLVLTHVDPIKGTVKLTLNNPQQYNELDLPLACALTAAIDNVQQRISETGDIRAVILTGAGKHFCVGVKHADDSTLVAAMHAWSFARPSCAALMHWFTQALVAVRKISVETCSGAI